MSTIKGVMRFDKKKKLNSRYVSPYRILKKICKVTYELELLAELARVHPFFHISLLKKCVGDLASILPLKDMDVKDSITSEEVPVEIFYFQVRKLRYKEVASVKVFMEESIHRGSNLGSRNIHEAQVSSPHYF